MKNKIKFNIAFLSLLLIFALSSVNVNAAGSCGGCSSYSYIEQSTTNGLVGYCINPGVKGSLKTASSTVAPIELSGSILSNWAQAFNTAKKQQIAYRLIALENGLTSVSEENKCIYNGCYTNDAEFNEVYNSWKQQSNKKINRSSSSMYITGNVTKSNGKFTANLMVTGPSGQVINLSVNGGTNVNISKTTLNGSGNVVVTGDLLPECSDGDDNVTVIATTKTASSSTSTGTTIPGTPSTTTSSVRYLYYPSVNGTQGFIVPGDSQKIEELISTPGKKPGYIPGKTDSNSFSDSATYEINIEPSDCEKNCDVQYSGDFKCDGSGSQTKYINETNNIISCITSGKYRNNCGGTSIQKTTDVDSNVNLSNSNPYCRVYCKEDISFNLPGEVKVKNGSYFTLSKPFTSTDDISIEGKRSCYVGAPKNSKSNGIDKEQYVKDIKAKQNEIIAKYNEYLKKKAEYEAYSDAKNNPKTSTCSGTCNKKGVTGATATYYENANTHEYKIYSANYDENGSVTSYSFSNGSATFKYGEEYAGATGCNGSTPICAAPTKIDDPNLTSEYYTGVLDQISTLNDQLNEIVKKYKSCFDWTNNYCSFDPKLTFSYEEVYNSQVSGELVQKGKIEIGKTKDGEYYTKVDLEYNGKNNGKSEKNQNYIKVVGTEITTVKKSVDMTNTYVKKVTTSKKSFEGYTNNVVCSYHPVGTIVVGDNCNKDGNYIKLNGNGYVFPVALEHKETRQYNYNLEVSNIGAPGDDNSCTTTGLNRVVGDSCSKYEQASSKLEAKYTCQYSSCPECEVECVCPKDSPNCYVEDKICKYKECDDCVVICMGCTWNDGDLAFGYKQVSLNDVFPNTDSTETGYNWNTNSSVNPQAAKADDTLEEIQEKGQEAYKTAQYSYTLSPKVMSDIREYNAKANRETSVDNIPVGGYSNDTLKCTNGVQCKSSFLDWIKKNTKAENKRNDKWTNYEDGSSWK